MKKFLMLMMASVLLLGATSCTSCKREKQNNETMVEKSIKTDYAYMETTYEDFVWYEAQVVLDNFIDEDNEASVNSVANVFQYLDTAGQPHVVIFTHSSDGCDTSYHDDFWLEDCVIEPSDIKITFNEAYDWLMKANYKKPHSNKCALRKSVGPYDSNPQYMFGNIYSTLFVDAVTGNVSDTDPAFVPCK